MRTQRRVFEKLSEIENKVELASKKIELSVADDVTKGLKNIKKSYDDLNGLMAQVEKEKDKYEKAQVKAYKSALDAQDNLEAKVEKLSNKGAGLKDVLAKVEKIAKELGVSPNDVKGYKELKSELQNYPDLAKKVAYEASQIPNVTI